MFKFELLEIWILANEYADEVYEITKKFPNYLQISLKSTFESVSQLARAKRRGYITEKTIDRRKKF